MQFYPLICETYLLFTSPIYMPVVCSIQSFCRLSLIVKSYCFHLHYTCEVLLNVFNLIMVILTMPGLRSAAEIVGSNPTGAWIFVCCECCVLSARGLCDELITRPEMSYRLWCVVVCDIENLKNEEAMTRIGAQPHSKKKTITAIVICK
jgi:hypothetical protein